MLFVQKYFTKLFGRVGFVDGSFVGSPPPYFPTAAAMITYINGDTPAVDLAHPWEIISKSKADKTPIDWSGYDLPTLAAAGIFVKQINDVADPYVIDAGSANTISITLPNPPANGWPGMIGKRIAVKIAASNTAATTIAVIGLAGTKAVKKQVTTALAANDLLVGGIYEFIYDGTNVQLVIGEKGEVGATGDGSATLTGSGAPSEPGILGQNHLDTTAHVEYMWDGSMWRVKGKYGIKKFRRIISQVSTNDPTWMGTVIEDTTGQTLTPTRLAEGISAITADAAIFSASGAKMIVRLIGNWSGYQGQFQWYYSSTTVFRIYHFNEAGVLADGFLAQLEIELLP